MTRLSGVVTYPTPAYSNVPIQSQNYQPSRFVISGITLGFPTIITTTENMNYVIGQLVRLNIPSSYGSTQLNGVSAYVITLPSANQVGLEILSTSTVDPFIASSSSNQPQILAIGDISNGQINQNGINSTLNFIPGSFINISPN